MLLIFFSDGDKCVFFYHYYRPIVSRQVSTLSMYNLIHYVYTTPIIVLVYIGIKPVKCMHRRIRRSNDVCLSITILEYLSTYSFFIFQYIYIHTTIKVYTIRKNHQCRVKVDSYIPLHT